MHEYSLAASIIKFCENEILKQPGYKIQEVTLLIGVMGGVDGSLLNRALNHLKENGPFSHTIFINEIAPLIILCKNCKGESNANEIIFHCPLCHHEDIEFKGGRELLIKNIKFKRNPKKQGFLFLNR